MKRPSKVYVCLPVILLLLAAVAPSAWAGAAEEVAEVLKQRIQWGQEGNLDALMTTYADNAVLIPGRAGFRAEGKDAIRAYLTNLYQTYPTRQGLVRHRLTRVYGNETVVIVNGYTDSTFVDRTGQPSPGTFRTTITFVKTGGKWLVVDQHISRMP